MINCKGSYNQFSIPSSNSPALLIGWIWRVTATADATTTGVLENAWRLEKRVIEGEESAGANGVKGKGEKSFHLNLRVLRFSSNDSPSNSLPK
jgi:hypothetical protein